MVDSHEQRAMPPSVRIVLLNWNGWQDTARCIESLRALTYPSVQIVVVDNCSADDSVARLRELCPEVCLVESPLNLGFAGGCNLGIRHQLGEPPDYVWLLNSDTTVAPVSLTALVAALEGDCRAAVAGGVITDEEGDAIQLWGGGTVSFLSGLPRGLRGPGQGGPIDYISGACLLARMRMLDEIGLLDDDFFMYWEDTDLCFRLRRAGWSLVVAPDAVVHHRGSVSLGFQSPAYDYYFTFSARRFFRKHASFPFWPCAVSSLGRLVRRAARAKWANVRAVARAMCDRRCDPPGMSVSGVLP